MSDIQNTFNQLSSDLYNKYGNVWVDQNGNSTIKDMVTFTNDVMHIQNTISKMITDAGILQVSVTRKDRLYDRYSPAFLAPIDGAIYTEILNCMAGMDETRYNRGFDYWKPLLTTNALSVIIMRVNSILQERLVQKKLNDEKMRKLEEERELIRKQNEERQRLREEYLNKKKEARKQKEELLRKQNEELERKQNEERQQKEQLERKQKEEHERIEDEKKAEELRLAQEQIDILRQQLHLQQKQNELLRQHLDLQQKQNDLVQQQQSRNNTSIFKRIFH